MDAFRRELLKLAGAAIPFALVQGATAQSVARSSNPGAVFDVRTFGAVGDGRAIDTPAVNRAIEAAAAAGGGAVRFGAGTYACYSIHLKSFVALYLEPGATILAASVPIEGTASGGYDPAEPNTPWEAYQDFGHNHWHNSLIWGEDIHDCAILGPGLIWGKGLSRGAATGGLPKEDGIGVADKAIALKNSHNVLLRDFSILQGGHFGILATGVDNLTIDNLKIDTNRDGMNIDCCRNVRISNCSVNSPWDDGICPKSSFALGYPRATENVTISNCYVTGGYELGTLLDGTFKRFGADVDGNGSQPTGRIKCGTESNGGFKNITISNCAFESCRGLALETVDGAHLEDITVTGVTMRDIRNAPFFLRLGARLRGPERVPVGTLRRVIISDVTCYGPANDMPAIISGIPGHLVEDIRFSNIYMVQKGGGSAQMASVIPPEQEAEYPEPIRFAPLPAQGFFIRHAKNIEFSNVEIASDTADARPFFWLNDVDGADFFRVSLPDERRARAFLLNETRRFRNFGSATLPDSSFETVSRQEI